MTGRTLTGKLTTVLVISPDEEDHRRLAGILKSSQWAVRHATSCSEAVACMREMWLPVIICEKDLPDGNWLTVLHRASVTACPPAVVVASRLADSGLWEEMLERGARDLLAKPFRAQEVLWAVESGWQAWKRQWEVWLEETRDLALAA
jgi:DNA-binding NtrC family response regulator